VANFVKVVGDIEQQIFLPKGVCLRLFAWRTKFGEIDPGREKKIPRRLRTDKLPSKLRLDQVFESLF